MDVWATYGLLTAGDQARLRRVVHAGTAHGCVTAIVPSIVVSKELVHDTIPLVSVRLHPFNVTCSRTRHVVRAVNRPRVGYCVWSESLLDVMKYAENVELGCCRDVPHLYKHKPGDVEP
jgi:hypothetical protein